MASGIIKSIVSLLFKPSTELTNANDMNNIGIGVYKQGGSNLPTNAPSSASNAYIVVFRARSTDLIQVWFSVNTNAIYYRVYTEANGWSAWKTIQAS